MVLFLQAEEERLAEAQTQSDEKQKAGKLTPGVAAKKELIAAMPTKNTEGDSLSINSSVLQVCDCADTASLVCKPRNSCPTQDS